MTDYCHIRRLQKEKTENQTHKSIMYFCVTIIQSIITAF